MHAISDAPDWIDLNQFERLYPYSRRQAWYWLSAGLIPSYRPTKRKILLRRSESDKFLASKRVGADLDCMVDEAMCELRRR
jgi:hypothetical protein